jgi:hypothetical protein
MRNILLKFKTLFVVLIIAGFASSCATQTNVGKYTEAKGTEYVYSKAKQMYLFWGLIPIGKTHTETPADGNCQVETRFNIVDIALTYVCLGFFGMQTVKVKAKR